MHHEEEWKRLKKEYRSISVPCDAADQLSYVVEHAKSDRIKAMRKRRGTMRTFGVLAVAAVIVVLLLPGTRGMFLLGGASGGTDNSIAFDTVTESVKSAESEKGYTNIEMNFLDKYTAAKPSEPESEEVVLESKGLVSISEEEMELISMEILRQMEALPTEFYEFSAISPEQEMYLDAENCLVVVFPRGSIAAEELGDISFTIPKDVFSVQE